MAKMLEQAGFERADFSGDAIEPRIPAVFWRDWREQARLEANAAAQEL